MDKAVTEGGVKYKSTGSSWLAPVNAIPNPQQPHAPCRRWDPAQRTALMAQSAQNVSLTRQQAGPVAHHAPAYDNAGFCRLDICQGRLLEKKEERGHGSPKDKAKNVKGKHVPAADIIKNGLDATSCSFLG